MTLLGRLIRGGATAIPAIPATHWGELRPTVATVATIAVATGPSGRHFAGRYDREERAAIFEFEAGLTRVEAEKLAGLQ